MRLNVREFLGDRSGTSFEGIALSVSIIAVGFVASADMLDYMMKKRGEAQVASISTAPGKAELDMTPTASLPKLIQRSVLDPCTGIVK